MIEATAAPEGLKRHEAEALDLVATKADIELSDDIKRLATEALGYREKTVSTRTVVSYEEASSPIDMLCNRGELLSSCVLHRVATKKDAVVKVFTHRRVRIN